MKDLLYRLLSVFRNRLVYLALFMLLGFFFIWIVLYRTQILQHEHYVELQAENLYTEQSIAPERGNIYDAKGNPLAINTYSKALMFLPDSVNQKLIDSIESVLKILDKNGEELTLTVEFPIGYEDGPGYFFKDDYSRTYNPVANEYFLAEVFNTSRDELTDDQKGTTATECIEILCKDRFGISMDKTQEEILRILSVRYAIFSARFDTSVSVLIAREISDETEAMIMERTGDFVGFSVETLYSRVYPEGELFAHIVGYVGRISEWELDYYTAKGLPYTAESVVGKTGIESSMEEILRGQEGVVRTETDVQSGAILNSVTMEPALKGDDIYLTIDKEEQQRAYDALYEQIKSLLISKITGVSGKQGATYSAVDIFCALIENHFLPASLLEKNLEGSYSYSENIYLDAFRSTCDTARETSCDELYDLILNTRIPMEDFQDWNQDLYDILITNMRDEIHLSYKYQEDEDFYPEYLDGHIAPYDFFVYCLDHDCLDESIYGFEKNDSYDTRIGKILDIELPEIQKLPEFTSFIYSFVMSTGRFPEESFLYLLYEQGLIREDDGTRRALENEEMSVIQIIKLKIERDEITPAQINLDPCSGSVTITDPDTGMIRAIVSYPTYDPNLFMNSNAYYYGIIDDRSGPLSFRAVEELRAIGSTFKMVTGIAALDTKIITASTEIYDDVTFPYANTDSDPHCWSTASHGSINVVQALDYSCNYFFYQLGFLLSEPVPAREEDPPFGPLSTPDSQYYFDDDVGLAKLKKYTDLLGLSTPTNIEIAESTPIASTIDAVRSAIGQGNGSYSCANLNRYTCTLANGGSVYDLYLIHHRVTAQGEEILTIPHLDHKTNLSTAILTTIKEGMRLVVTDDHQPEFAPLEAYRIQCAGKTGTAQEDESRPDHSLFTGYVNLNHPEMVITVMIPFGGGSKNAIPVFVDIVAQTYGVLLDR